MGFFVDTVWEALYTDQDRWFLKGFLEAYAAIQD